MGYLYQIGGRQPLPSGCRSTCGRGFLMGCQLDCIGQSLLLGHSELWLMHKLHRHPRGFVDLVKGAKVVLDLYSPCIIEDALRQYLLARRAGGLTGAIPRCSGAFIGHRPIDLYKQALQSCG